ncbi:MAG: hypothetical protein WAL90_00105 [Desulfobacterales bacterium]
MAMPENSARFTFFFPEARVLGKDEVDSLPADKRQTAATSGQQGVWLEINCPDKSCISDDGRITIPAAGNQAAVKKDKGVWLNLFCPEDSCELQQNTDLP